MRLRRKKKKQRMKDCGKKNKKPKRYCKKVAKLEGSQFQDGPAIRERAKDKYQQEADLLFTTIDPE